MRIGRRTSSKGFSLVELIVIIAIVGLLAVGGSIAISTMTNANVTSAAKKLSSLLDKLRLESMSRTGKVYLEIGMDGNEYYGRLLYYGNGGNGSDEGERVALGNRSLSFVAYKGTDAIEGTGDVISEGTSVYMTCLKSNGKFREGSSTDSVPAHIYGRIVIRGTKTMTVHMVEETGRNYISQ